MRKLGTTLCGAVALTIGLAAGSTAASASSSATAAITTAGAHKAAFCAGNVKIDKAGANVNSEAGFLTVLKHNKAALSAMGKNLPSGTVGTDARKEIAAAQKAIASGNVNDLNTVPQSAGGDIDTYCGVDGNGNALPSYFATGKGSSFCATFLPIFAAVGNANGPAGALAALEANKTQIAQLATEVSGLPASIQAKANATVTMAQTAITQNSAASLNGNGNGPAPAVALYCGQNR
jgi:hypothetical protein